MTLTLFETLRRIMREEMASLRVSELGVVQEQHSHSSEGDTDNYACTVMLRNSGLVLKQVPVATERIGTASIPAVGDMVLVQFIGGDVNAPVIIGSLYNDQDRPPANDDGQSIMHLPLGAGEADAVHIELHSGDQRQIIIKLGKAISINVQDDDPVVQLDVDSDKASVKIDRDGAVTITSKGDLKIEANNVSIEGQGGIDIKASGEMNLKGATVNIN